MQDVQTILPTGTVIQGRYVIEDLLGKGGFGAVYLVRDQRVKHNLFALKEVIDPNKRERVRFTFECEVLRRLDHPALPRVYRVFEDDKNDRAYMLMDYVEGPNLEILRQRQPGKRFPVKQVLTIMKPIMDAVSYLHSQRPPIIHRDIKPANIIVPNSGDETVLVDFGIAKEYDPETTTTAIRHCSPGYGAPEQYGMGTNTRTDIYGLGATMYTLLTGIVPADAFYRTTQLGSKDIDPLEPLTKLAPSVPKHVADAIQRAMTINIDDRFPTVQEFWQALNAKPIVEDTPLPLVAPVALAATATQEPLVTKQTPDDGATVVISPKPKGRRRRLGAILLILLALLLAIASAAGLWFVVNHSTSAPRTVITTVPKPNLTHTSVPVHRPTATPHARPTAKPTPGVTPTTAPPSYPILAGSYSGQIHNIPANINSTMSLSSIQQSGGNISGYFAVGSGLQGNGSFNGSVGRDNSINYLVQAYANHLPLYFYGKINSDGSMSGSYCSYQNGQCNYQGGGYGTWNVSPQSTGSGPGSYTPITAPPIASASKQDRNPL